MRCPECATWISAKATQCKRCSCRLRVIVRRKRRDRWVVVAGPKEIEMLLDFDRRLRENEDAVRDIEAVVMARRRPFSREVTERWRERLVREPFLGRSPLGSGIQLLDDHGCWLEGVEFDHFFAKDKNGLYDGWPVSKRENQSLLRRERDRYRDRFDLWVRLLREEGRPNEEVEAARRQYVTQSMPRLRPAVDTSS